MSVWLVGWTAGTGYFDYQVGRGFIKQLAACNYNSTTGTILRSQVIDRSDDDGSSYAVDISYQYTVNDRVYSSNVFNHGMKSASQTWANSVVTQHPAGSTAIVYFDPANPQDALLTQGIDGSMLHAVVFLIPFNVIALATLYAMVGALFFKKRGARAPAGGVPIRADGHLTRASLHSLTPLLAAAIAVGGSAFVLTFALVFTTGPYPSPLWPGILALLSVVGAGCVAYQFASERIRAGKIDLVIDPQRKIIQLPPTCGRKAPLTVAMDALAAIEVEKYSKTDNDGDTTHYFSPTLAWSDPAGLRTAHVIEWTDQERAEAFVKWLREALGAAPQN